MERGARRGLARRPLVLWTARFGLLCASLCLALLLLVLLDPLLPRSDWMALMPSEAFHHTRVPGVWVSQTDEWGPHEVYIGAAGWREPPPATASQASRPARSSPNRLQGSARTPAKRFRMAVMGDSFVEAVEVAWEDTFVARLQARSAGRGEVLNRGTSSYSPLLYLLRWRRQVAHERPTHLLLVLYANDVDGDRNLTAKARRRGGAGDEDHSSGGIDDVAQLYWEGVSWPWSLEESRLFRLYSRWRGRAGVVVRASWEEDQAAEPDLPARRWRSQTQAMTPLTGSYLLELAAQAREAGVEFTLSAVPHTWELRDPALRAPELRVGPTFADNVSAWAAANGVRYVDLQAPFREAAAEGQRLFFERDGHFTPAGHAVAAEVFAAFHPDLFAVADTPGR